MTIQEACNILEVDQPDDNKTIKLQFRKLIAKYHPDAVGSDASEHLKKAQLINEAYAILRKMKGRAQTKGSKKSVWNGKVIPNAFAERIIYMQDISWDDDRIYYYEVAKGKYEWDPELEEFECLIRSLNRSAIELLEEVESQNEIYFGYDLKTVRFQYQVQLFHLLASQYIVPVTCLKKLAKPEKIDSDGRSIYKFQAFIGAKGSELEFSVMSKLKPDDFVYPTSLKNNRIHISDEFGASLGHLSFAEDQLYYVILPILQNHRAQVKCIVAEKEIHKRTRPYRVKVNVDLYLRLESSNEERMTLNHNNKIQSLLNQYAKVIIQLN